MRPSAVFLLCCIAITSPQDTTKELLATDTYNGVLDENTFLAIVLGTGTCLIIVFVIGIVLVCIKVGNDLFNSVEFQIHQAAEVTHLGFREDSTRSIRSTRSKSLPTPKIPKFFIP